MKMRREKVLANYLSKLNSKKWKHLLDVSQIPCIICNSQKILFTNTLMKNTLENLSGNNKDPEHDVNNKIINFYSLTSYSNP